MRGAPFERAATVIVQRCTLHNHVQLAWMDGRDAQDANQGNMGLIDTA